MRTVTSTPVRLVAALAASVALLSGCGAGEGLSGFPEPATAPAAAPAPEGAPAGGAPAADRASGSEYAAGAERQVARTASLTLVVGDLRATADRIRAITASLDGWVANESLVLPEGAIDSVPAGSWVVVSVPASRLDAVTDQVAALGTVRNRGASADDVTEVVVDLDARIRSLEASVTRLQELVGRAGSVADIAAVERELSNRQAELESLKSQRLQLAGAVERATLTVSLLTPTQSTTTNPLQTGWARGWSAFLASVSILVTVVAALLPFAAVAALVVVPLLWWRRRRRASARVDGVDVRAGQQDSPDQQPYGEGEAQRRPDDTVGDEDEGHRGQGRDQVAD